MVPALETIDNYQLVFRKQLESLLFTAPPRSWKSGTKGDVILLPGFLETWVFMRTIGDHLNKQGYRIHTIPSLKRNTAIVKDLSNIVENFIMENDLQEVFTISHSKGGLVSRYLLNYSPVKENIGLAVTIASPHQGTLFAKLRVLNLTEILPESELINKLSGQECRKIINLYPSFDSTVVPNSSLILQGARNIKLRVSGHTKILESGEMLDLLDNLLTSRSSQSNLVKSSREIKEL